MSEYNNIITNIENSMVGQLARALPIDKVACESLKGLTWQTLLKEEKEKPYFQSILKFIEHERSLGKVIYPKNSDIFNALALTPFEDLKVVILGQDPYHGPNQAHGLSFSVMPDVPFPPSLRNIFKELNSDIGCDIPKSGYLVNWAKQGVLLLNTVLSVEAGKPESHKGVGWQQFTDKIIKLVNEYKRDVVFILWGSHAQQKIELIDQNKHFIIRSVHPSPLSASRGFFGSRPFSKTNEFLKQRDKCVIEWDLTAVFRIM